MYLDWVLQSIAILIILLLVYAIYRLYRVSEGFILVQTPSQIYTIPIIEGVTGRYVRIRPSLDPKADGYLTISQIQVIDINGENIALKKKVFATSDGGSEVDRMFGRKLYVNGFNQFRSGISDGPSCVVDGQLEPRNTLENVFETGVRNTAEKDTQYLEIDLSGNNIISSIVYIGRGDAETRSITDINSNTYYLTQVDRQKGMRVEIRDNLNNLTFGGPGISAAQFQTTQVKQTMKINNQVFTINPDLGSAAMQKTVLNIPNIESYKAFAEVFRTAAPLTAPPPSTDVRPTYIPDVNPTQNNKELIKALYDTKFKSCVLSQAATAANAAIAGISALNFPNEVRAVMISQQQAIVNAGTTCATIDLSNNIFPAVVADYPISFYNDFYAPACGTSPTSNFCRAAQRKTLAPTIPINIFGAASALAQSEMIQSINICKKLYLGSQAGVENYIRVKYSETIREYQVYLRGSCDADDTPLLGASDLIVAFEGGGFVTKVSAANQALNDTVFKCFVGTASFAGSSGSSGSSGSAPLLALVPLGSRNFLIDWIYNRMTRYRRFSIETAEKNLDARLATDFQYSWTKPYLGDNCETCRVKSAIAGIWRYLGLDKTAKLRRDEFINRTGYRGGADTYVYFSEAKALLDVLEAAKRRSETPLEKLTIPTYIDVRSTMLMDSIAQQFYEFLDGNFAMTYIYDAFPLGSTMIDIRFQLYVHDDVPTSYGPINDLKAQYNRIISATTQSRDVLNDAEYYYEGKLFDLQEDAIQSMLNPFEGAVVRLFYEKTNTGVRITGLIFDAKAVTSFIPELNCGIPVPIGPAPGNINYEPNIVYTKNRTETLDCTNETTLKRVMRDYVNLMNDSVNNYPLSKASPPINVNQGELVVTEILGSQQISDRQCAVTWKESLYDQSTNSPKLISPMPILPGPEATVANLVVNGTIKNYDQCVTNTIVGGLARSNKLAWDYDTTHLNTTRTEMCTSYYKEGYWHGGTMGDRDDRKDEYKTATGVTEVTRSGVISYTKDETTWFSALLTPDFAGFKLFPRPSVPECRFNTDYYRYLYSSRYTSTPTNTTLINDFLINDFNNGLNPVCPYTIPNYIYNVTDAGMTLNQYTSSITSSNPIVRPEKAITLRPTSIKITKPIPIETTLDNLSDLCPAASCKDMDILYTLVDQYNSDSTLPGTILSVTHAFTPNKYQCDVKASINYGGTIDVPKEENVLDPQTGLYNLKQTYEKVVKGTVTYRSGSSGQLLRGSKRLPMANGEAKNITLALYVQLDPLTCTYTLADASGQNSGYSIQPNTPDLYTPMIYSNELIKRNIGKLDSTGSLTLSGQTGSAINAIQTDFAKATGSTKQTLKSYRMQTYAIAGTINSLSVCRNSPQCNTSTVQGMIKDYFKTRVVTTGEQIDTILRTSSIDGKSCDATFSTTSNRTLTNRFLFASDATSTNACVINGHIGTQDLIGNAARGSNNTKITDEQILDIKKELATTLRESFIPYKNPSVSAFTNYSATSTVAPEALDVRSFGQDSGRNTDYSIKDAQFDTPLKQVLPPSKKPSERRPVAYKFLRFTPLETRSPNAAAVNVGKFIFFYDERPLLLKGSVTNPMGTWEGTMKDVIGPDIRPGWSDSHKKSLTFAFRDPTAVDAYSFTTALPEMGIDGDPVSWKLEGSSNGTFWTILDTQKRFNTPITRFADLDKMYIDTI